MFTIRIAREFVFLDVLADRGFFAPMLHLIHLRIFAAAAARRAFTMHFTRLLLRLTLPVAVSGLGGRLSARSTARLTAFAACLCSQLAILGEAAPFRRNAFSAFTPGFCCQIWIL